MARDNPERWFVAALAAIAEAVVWAVAIARGGPRTLVVAIVFQLLVAILIAWNLRRRRVLIAALSVTVPVVGPIAAVLAVTVSGHGGRDLLREPWHETPAIAGPQIVDALVGALPACEAVLSPDREIRRSSMTRLARRATASDLAILRWARAQSSGEHAVEIALVLEDVVARFETRVVAAQTAAAGSASYDARSHAFGVLVEGICSGLVDEPLKLQLAVEARQHHEAAIAADAERASGLLADRARLELAMDRPEVVLDLITPLLRGTADPDLLGLYKQAAYAARRFELAAELTARRSRAQERA